MDLVNLGTVEKGDFYLDVAFSKASKVSSQSRGGRSSRLAKVKRVELKKIQVVSDSLGDSLDRIVHAFPSIDQLSEFYVELIDVTVGVDEFRKSLSRINWTSRKISELYRDYSRKVKVAADPTLIISIRKAFYGRVSSLLKQLNPPFVYLERARSKLKSFPSIRAKMFTVAIAGFPNVGKTTLLFKLTGSRAEIANYSFTTKGINVAYAGSGETLVQFLDTPGSLNRFHKMNTIEKQAYLAVKYCADVVVYVFDLTEPYPLDDQIKLFEELRKFEKPIVIYLSKTDILEKSAVDAFCKLYNCVTDANDLKKTVFSLKKEEVL